MLLSNLLKPIINFDPSVDVEINHIVSDSRKVKPGDVFAAIKGGQVDGEQFIADAIQNGAVAVLFDSDNQQPIMGVKDGVPHIALPQLGMQLGYLSARLYDFPTDHLSIVGVTGTNGKTSFSQFFAQCLQMHGEKTAVVGTLGSGVYGELQETGFTTPDALTLQALLADFVKQEVKNVSMEVSSHAIDQHRIGGVEFDIAVFTNLTQDHLDYHGDMEAYANVKHFFLTEYPASHLVLNVDDAYGLQWANELAQDRSVFAYSCQPVETLDAHVPHVYVAERELSLNGMTAKVVTPWGEGELKVNLVGEFNLSNVLAVLTALCVRGMDLAEALALIAKLEPVPGRMQMVQEANRPLVVVDYAHTPDALKNALESLRAHTQGELICVFGCGGDRDVSKRPIMADMAEKYSDKVIITSDNPRTEDPEQILKDIMQGFSANAAVYQELNRSQAIKKSIQLAKEGDCILIAGKGAERFQLVAKERLPFDDVAVAKDCLASY